MNLSAQVIPPSSSHPEELNLSWGAENIYDALVGCGRRVADARGYVAAVTQVHFFCPGEIMAHALGMARSTLYRKLKELKEADLVDARAHYVTHKGRTKADGMVWAVKMHPERSGRVSVPYDALKASYRCLSADIADGRTAFRQIGQSKEHREQSADIELILSWALPPQPTKNPVIGMTVRCDLEQILDVPFVDKVDRNAAVDGAAVAMSQALGDKGGLMFYRWLLWQLLRLEAIGKDAPWNMIYEQVRRAQADAREGFARKPGALLISRLKAGLWWDEIKRSPHVKVGERPSSARMVSERRYSRTAKVEVA